MISHNLETYLNSQKASAIKIFKVYKTKVEKQLHKKNNFVKLDRGGEFHGTYDEIG